MIGVLEIIDGYEEIFDVCPGVICSVSCRYLIWVVRYLVGILQIFDLCPRDI